MNKKKEVKNMDKELMKAIHENHIKAYKETQAKKEKEEKRKHRKETLISIILLIIFLVIMILNWRATDKAINECMQEGYKEYYCISKLA